MPGKQGVRRDGELAHNHRLQRSERLRQQRPAGTKPIAWERAMETHRDALLVAGFEQSKASPDTRTAGQRLPNCA
jgi:hypothetical protein